MLDAIKYGLRNLFNLAGRDARQTFWYFVLLIFILQFVAGLLIAVPLVVTVFSSVADAIQSNADPATLEARMMGSIAGMLGQMMWFSIGLSVVSGLLVLPSLVRRLHDSDLSGWWVVLPGAFQAISLSQTPEQMKRMVAMITTMNPENPPNQIEMMQQQGLLGMMSYVAIGLVIYFGVRKSTPGANRFGEASVSF